MVSIWTKTSFKLLCGVALSSAFALTRSVTTKPCLSPMDTLMLEPPLLTGVGRGWCGKEDDRCLYFRMDMPGLGEEHIKINMDRKPNTNTNTLTIQGEKQSQKAEEAGKRIYKAAIDIPHDFFNCDEIKSEIKNGVLKIFVPKVEIVESGKKFVEFKVAKMDEEQNPFLHGVKRRGWYVEPVTANGCLVVNIDMPGLDSGDVKVYNERDTVVVEAIGEEEDEYEGGGRRCVKCRVDVNDFNKSTRMIAMGDDGVCSCCSSSY